MGRVIILPGCMGSTLTYQTVVAPNPAQLTRTYWADREQLKKNGLDPMELDGSVIGARAANALDMTAGVALPDYYQRAFNRLEDQLLGTAFQTPMMYSYDWRQSLAKTADALVALIKTEGSVVSPVTLVGHSQGGLIARIAYYKLAGESKANLIDRIICLGTPHYGTFRIVALWTGIASEGILFMLQKVLKPGLGILLTTARDALARVVSITMSFPAFYELLPTFVPDSPAREMIVRLYRLGDTYQKLHAPYGVAFRKALLDNAVQGTQAILADGASIPPGRKLVCVRGNGWPTWETWLSSFTPKTNSPVIDQEAPGDGTTSIRSAYIEGSEVIDVDSPHDRLFITCVEDGILRDIITANWKPTVSTPPPPFRENVTPPTGFIHQMPLAPSDFPARRKAGNKRRS